MGFGDSFKKKLQDVAEKAAPSAATPKAPAPRAPAPRAPAPARPPADRPFPAKPIPARAGASSGPMFRDQENTVRDSVLQARMRKQKQEETEAAPETPELPEAGSEEFFETDEKDRTSAQEVSYGEKDRTSAEEVAYGARAGAENDSQDQEPQDEDEEAPAQDSDRSFEVPVGWRVGHLSSEEFWAKVFDLEDAQMGGAAAFRKALARHGLESAEHFAFVRGRFMVRHGNDPDFQQAMVNARTAQTRSEMAEAAGSELLSPIDGVSLETYATIQARRGKLQPQTAAAFGRLLAEYGLDAARWAKVDKAWMARLSDRCDPTATAAVNAEYAKHLAAAGQG